MSPSQSDPRIAAAHAALNALKTTGDTIAPGDAEKLLGDAVGPLLEVRGYALEHRGRARDGGIDFLARRAPTAELSGLTIGIELKHTRSPMALNAVHQLIGAAMLADIDRAILVSANGFTQAARAAVERSLPVRVELLGYNELAAWAETIDGAGEAASTLAEGIKAFSRFLALEIAKDPSALSRLEWFDMERIIAEIFDGLGFKVTLTPPAKDGGKDVVLEFTLRGRTVVYYVEVKHWRSATKVGSGIVGDFVKVIARENVAGGLLLSTHGYTGTAFEHLTELERERVKFGGREKVLTLCKTYSKQQAGLWSPPNCLSEILHEEVC